MQTFIMKVLGSSGMFEGVCTVLLLLFIRSLMFDIYLVFFHATLSFIPSEAISFGVLSCNFFFGTK